MLWSGKGVVKLAGVAVKFPSVLEQEKSSGAAGRVAGLWRMEDLDLRPRRKTTCSPAQRDAADCEIPAKSCQTRLQVLTVSGEEEEKKEKNSLQLPARLFSCNLSAVRMVLCSRTPYQVPPLSLSLSPLFSSG